MRAMGLEIFAERPAAGMTAVCVPAGIDARQLLKRLEARFGVKLAGGQLALKGRIFRMAHIGLLDELDIIATLAAIELVLDELGHPVTLGAAAAAGRPGRSPRPSRRARTVASLITYNLCHVLLSRVTMPKVIVLDKLAQEGLDLLEAAPGIEFEVRTGLKGDDLRQALAEFDGAICRSGVKITAEALEGNHRLKAIVRAGVGTDNIDSKAATRLGIVVMNTPAGNTLSTAEHTIAMMLALSRNIAPAYQSLIEGKWDRNKYMGTQLADKTLGIVGLGRIGQAVGARAKALGNARDRLRSVSVERADRGAGHRAGRQRGRDAAAGRLSDRPHAADRRNAQT